MPSTSLHNPHRAVEISGTPCYEGGDQVKTCLYPKRRGGKRWKPPHGLENLVTLPAQRNKDSKGSTKNPHSSIWVHASSNNMSFKKHVSPFQFVLLDFMSFHPLAPVEKTRHVRTCFSLPTSDAFQKIFHVTHFVCVLRIIFSHHCAITVWPEHIEFIRTVISVCHVFF